MRRTAMAVGGRSLMTRRRSGGDDELHDSATRLHQHPAISFRIELGFVFGGGG